MASRPSQEATSHYLEVAEELERLRAEFDRLGREMAAVHDKSRLIQVHRERARLALAVSGIGFELSRERQAPEAPTRFPRATEPPKPRRL